MPKYKRQTLIEDFIKSFDAYRIINWEYLGYCDHTSARSCLERTIKKCDYPCHMARDGQNLYIVRNGCEIPRNTSNHVYGILSQRIWNFIKSDETKLIINDPFITIKNKMEVTMRIQDIVHGVGHGQCIRVIYRNPKESIEAITLVKDSIWKEAVGVQL